MINQEKHKEIFREEFELAQKILKDEFGMLKWSFHAYQAFQFKSVDVNLIFYPHKTSAGNYHVRVRDANSKDKQKANLLMDKLKRESGNNCTFTRKLGG